MPCLLQKKRQKVTSDSAYSLTIIIYPSSYFPSPPIVSTNSLYLSHSLSPICPPLILSPNSLFPSHSLSSITSPLILLSYCLPSHFSPSIQPSHFPSLPLSPLPFFHPHISPSILTPSSIPREEGGGRRGSDLWCKPPHTGLL